MTILLDQSYFRENRLKDGMSSNLTVNFGTSISLFCNSSTMVIAGVYLGLIIDDTLILLIDISCSASIMFFN